VNPADNSSPSWALPEEDYWSTPFAKTLLSCLELEPGNTVLDIACGGGIPAFYIAEKVGTKGQVLAVDQHPAQIARCRSIQGRQLPWLKFEQGDMKNLPASLDPFDRITGNLSFMFFRPQRYEALKSVLRFLKPGGQIVLTFPSLGTFDSIWKRVDREMEKYNLDEERKKLAEYIRERPSAEDGRGWLRNLGMNRIQVLEEPLEVQSGAGNEFLTHPLLRGGFLDDAYECFEDQILAEKVMQAVAKDLDGMRPLLALRCALSARKPLG